MCQLFISKDFETSLLTLLGVSLVLWRRKADNAHSNPLFYGPRPLTSQHLHFQFPITSLLKIFVRSRRDWKEKMPGRIPTLPLLQSLRLRKPIAVHCALWCIVMPTHGGGGDFCREGRGGLKAWNDDDVGLMMKWSAFYILSTKEFLRARGEHILLFALLLFLELCFAPCIPYFGSWNKNWGKVLAGLEKMKT